MSSPFQQILTTTSATNAIAASSAVPVECLHARGANSLASNAHTVLPGLDSQASPQSGQKEEMRRKNAEAQMQNDSNHSETTLFQSDLDTALQSLGYGSQTNQAYQNHPSRSREDITNSRAERHSQTSTQPKNVHAVSEPMATTSLDCGVLPLPSSALDEEFLNLDFPNQERIYIDLEPQHSNSTSSSSDEKCHCLSHIIQSLNRNRQGNHIRRDSMNKIHLLNEAAEQFLMCDSNHSKLWYIILLALYQDADDSLSSAEEPQERMGAHSGAKGFCGNIKSNLDTMVCHASLAWILNG
ncbi:hypothetical protein COCVIDRAFT_43172 [Bipolaris victoriae FI3]|uniref:Probable transcription factor vicR n=1 Tax=Bipolaris victoriae (strain FI3) TaxID=930091 RepID=VICR_BIPV3|nr:hypothetical protein COCVIDRAFT_43172 [Bipolaris victoriae FI3]W7E3X3.1 RecName: Full=Probable transcription factor vicR; AltName: Full=Victorin biosynthesis cluster protein T [Bipolaris victoriae FI3]